jgi:hypothetical protein
MIIVVRTSFGYGLAGGNEDKTLLRAKNLNNTTERSTAIVVAFCNPSDGAPLMAKIF